MMGLMIGGVFVSAYQGDPTVEGPNYTPDRHDDMQAAFDAVDYELWVALMSQEGRTPGVMRKVSEDNFATFVDMRTAMLNGDVELAAELKAELGLGQGKMNHGSSKGQGGQGQGQRGMSGSCPNGN